MGLRRQVNAVEINWEEKKAKQNLAWKRELREEREVGDIGR